MKTIILTLFPEMFPGTLGHSLAGKALEKGLWSLETLDIRDFATDKHKTVDDKSYGGGTGLVMKPDVVGAAIDAAKAKLPNARLIYLTPRGVPFTQALAYELASANEDKNPSINSNNGGDIIILCGRYEGVDQRILDFYQPLEVSLGDYILSGGEVAALTLLDACIRLIPGVISKEEALEFESFSAYASPVLHASQQKAESASNTQPIRVPKQTANTPQKSAGLLEYPHYTSPPSWQGCEVPEILRSGNHQAVAKWRWEQAKAITKSRRPDLWERYVEYEEYSKNKTKD